MTVIKTRDKHSSVSCKDIFNLKEQEEMHFAFEKMVKYNLFEMHA